MTLLRGIQPPGEHPVVQEPERLATKRAVLVAVIFLAIFTAATLWAVAIRRREERRIEPQEVIPTPREVGKPQIGMVNQRLFELQLDAKARRAEQLRRLNSYGWIDRDKQIIHIPIERAMRLLSSEPGR